MTARPAPDSRPRPDLQALSLAAAAAPGDPERRFLLAHALEAHGRTQEAKEAYLAVLALDPGHFGALNDLGALLHRTDFRAAALTLYAEAVRVRPDEPIARINLANALIAADRAEEAEGHLLAALAADPGQPDAHQAMAALLEDRGEVLAAAEHRLESCRELRLFSVPHVGAGAPIRVLVLNSARGGNIPIRFLLDPEHYAVCVLLVESWRPGVPLPAHDVLFNAIGDADLCASALRIAGEIVRAEAASPVNRVEDVLRTGRLEVAERARGIPGVRPPRMIKALQADAAEAAAGLGYPLLARSPGFHTGRHFVRIEDPAGLDEGLAGLAGAEVLLIEPLPAAGADGRWRKYRVLFIGGAPLPLHLAVSRSWKTHYFTAGMEDDEEARLEEARFLDRPWEVLGAGGRRALEDLAREIRLDYFGVDFGLGPSGEILLFEANATMVVNPPPEGEIWAYRRPAVAAVLSSWRELVRARAGR